MADDKPIGRPSDYTDEIATEICARLMQGESIRDICADDGFPSDRTVYRWLASNETFRQQYAHAREVQAETLFDDILSIADDARNDWMERRGESDAGWVANGEHIQRSRLRVDSRKWMAGKLAPKKYGDKVQQEISGPDGGPVQLQRIERVIVDPKN